MQDRGLELVCVGNREPLYCRGHTNAVPMLTDTVWDPIWGLTYPQGPRTGVLSGDQQGIIWVVTSYQMGLMGGKGGYTPLKGFLKKTVGNISNTTKGTYRFLKGFLKKTVENINNTTKKVHKLKEDPS